MKIQYVSDLHLELKPAYPFPGDEAFQPVTDRDVLVLAGDIGEADDAWPFIRRELEVSPVIYVAGNHEYWTKLPRRWFEDFWEEKAATHSDLYYLNGSGATIGSIRFWGAPWYSDFLGRRDEASHQRIRRAVHDFSTGWNYSLWTIERHLKEHGQHTARLREQAGEVDVAVTHWPVTLEADPESRRPEDDPLVGYYINDQADLVREVGAKVWISGHLHRTHDYVIGETRCVSSSCGLPDQAFHPEDYSPTRTVDL